MGGEAGSEELCSCRRMPTHGGGICVLCISEGKTDQKDAGKSWKKMEIGEGVKDLIDGPAKDGQGNDKPALPKGLLERWKNRNKK